MVFINRLKNGVGKESDFYVPKTAKALVQSDEFSLQDNEISDKIKQGNLKLLYSSNVYVIKRDAQNGQIVLKDISEQTVELPTTLATYKPSKACPEIVFNGYMLGIDKNLTDLSPEEKAEIEKITSHFEKLKKSDPKKSAKHELKHVENSIYFNEEHKDNLALTHDFFIRKCFIDEISATVEENIESKAQNRDEAQTYVKKVFSDWMNNPSKKSYYSENGDFEHQWGSYEEKTKGLNTFQSEKMYKQMLQHFFTFKINGKNMDLSAAIDPSFDLPKAKSSSFEPNSSQYYANFGR